MVIQGFNKENRVGSGSMNPTPTPKPSPTATPVSTDVIDNIIQGRLGNSKIVVDPDMARTLTNPSLYEDMTNAQWSSIASLLKKLGKPVQGKEETKAILEAYYSVNPATMTTFKDLYTKLSSDYIPGLDTEAYKGPKTTIQLQDPLVIDSIIRGVYQSTLKREPNPNEYAARRKEVEAVINKGSTMTPKGKAKSVYTPGFTQAGAEEMIQKKIESGGVEVQEDLAQAKSLDFADFIGKLSKSI